MTKPVQIFLLIILFSAMLSMTIYASSYQNLLTEFSWSASPEWFQATIVDFYINQLILWVWVVTLEKRNLNKALWLIVFICFGSMGTITYLIQRIVQNKSLLKKEY
jgi:hypothetical protein